MRDGHQAEPSRGLRTAFRAVGIPRLCEYGGRRAEQEGSGDSCNLWDRGGLCSRQSARICVCSFSYSWPACSIFTKRRGEHQCRSSLTTEYWGLQMATLPWLGVSLGLCPQRVIISIGNNYFCSRSMRNRGAEGGRKNFKGLVSFNLFLCRTLPLVTIGIRLLPEQTP